MLPDGPYSVQSKDFVRDGDSEQVGHLDRQFVQLFGEAAPEERGGGYPTLLEAIAAHEAEFSGE